MEKHPLDIPADDLRIIAAQAETDQFLFVDAACTIAPPVFLAANDNNPP